MKQESSTTLELLFKNGKKHHLKKGSPLSFDGDRLFFALVAHGYVKRYLITDEGVESIQAIYGPKTAFPLTPVFSALLDLTIYEGDEVLYYETMTDTIFYALSKSELQEAVRANPELYKDLFHASGVRLKSNIQRLENISLKSADKRLADAVLHYARTFGKKQDNGEIVIDVPLTHQTLANILNIARETVSHAMIRLQDTGVVRMLPKFHISVVDMDALKKLRSS